MKLALCIQPFMKSLPMFSSSTSVTHISQQCRACYLTYRCFSEDKNIKRSNKPFRVLNVEVDKNDTFKSNLEYSKQLLEKYQQMTTKASSFGGEKGIQRHVHKQKKMLVTDRLKHLLDNPDDFLELSLLAGIGMEYGDVPRAGIITGIGKIHGKLCMILANDATVKGGTIYPISLKKQLRAQEIAEQNRLPVIYVVESGGAFLPMQSMIFPDKNQGGRVFYNQAVMSSMGIPQISVVCGSCTAGGAYIPTMSDEAVIIHKHGTIFLGGPPLVQAATGEIISAEELGGATMHCGVSGCTDYFAATEADGLATGRDIVASLNLRENLPITQEAEEPLYNSEDIMGLISKDNNIDIYQVIARLVDGSRLHEFKTRFGAELVTGFAYIQGYLVGIIGNHGELTEFAGDKGAHFVTLCEERRIPLVFLQNTKANEPNNRDSVGVDEGNKLRGHAKMMSAVSCTSVPKITFIIGHSIGPTSYIMGGRCTSPNFLFCWPNSVIGLTSPSDTVQMLCQEKLEDQSLSEEDKEAFRKKVAERCATETSAFYAASRAWNDGVVLPQDTRQVIHKCLEASLVYSQPAQLDNAVVRM